MIEEYEKILRRANGDSYEIIDSLSPSLDPPLIPPVGGWPEAEPPKLPLDELDKHDR